MPIKHSKEASTDELVKVLTLKELNDYLHANVLPEDFVKRLHHLRGQDPEHNACRRILKAMRLGISVCEMTHSKRAWQLRSVVLMTTRQVCIHCGHARHLSHELMIKRWHPCYGTHIGVQSGIDISHLPLEDYVRDIKVSTCSKCMYQEFNPIIHRRAS